MDKNSLLYQLVQERVKSLEAEKEKKESWKKNLSFPSFSSYITIWTYGQVDPYKQLTEFKAILERAQAKETQTEPSVLVKDISWLVSAFFFFLADIASDPL